MGIIEFFRKYFFNEKWTCNACGKEIFNDGYFCEECLKTMPYNNGIICKHCGRKVEAEEEYCSTCINNLVNLDKCRSSFVYEKPISQLIQKLKYKDKRYLAELFADYLVETYKEHSLNADLVTFVPMTVKAEKKRGYNQSYLLAKSFSQKLGLQLEQTLEKSKDTLRQATINRKERMTNLLGAFTVIGKKNVKDKKILIIDDVTTTGATGEILAMKLKKAGAKTVYLLTVASVPPKDKY